MHQLTVDAARAELTIKKTTVGFIHYGPVGFWITARPQ